MTVMIKIDGKLINVGDEPVKIEQDSSGIKINGIILQDASTGHDGLMTKEQARALGDKADLSDIPDISGLASIDYVDSKVTSVYRVMGSCTTADLANKAKTKGDVWNLTDAGSYGPEGTNVVYNGTEWDALGGTIDLSGYAKKSEIPDVSGKANQSDLNALAGRVTDTEGVANGAKAKADGIGVTLTTGGTAEAPTLTANVNGKSSTVNLPAGGGGGGGKWEDVTDGNILTQPGNPLNLKAGDILEIWSKYEVEEKMNDCSHLISTQIMLAKDDYGINKTPLKAYIYDWYMDGPEIMIPWVQIATINGLQKNPTIWKTRDQPNKWTPKNYGLDNVEKADIKFVRILRS